MARKAIVPFYDYRKKITNPYQLTQLQLMAEDWGMSISDICWRFITDGIKAEKLKREMRAAEIEEIKNYK